jgi:hypothetical protein
MDHMEVLMVYIAVEINLLNYPPKIYSDFGDFLGYFTVNTDSHTPAFNPQSLNGCSMAGFIWYHP